MIYSAEQSQASCLLMPSLSYKFFRHDLPLTHKKPQIRGGPVCAAMNNDLYVQTVWGSDPEGRG